MYANMGILDTENWDTKGLADTAHPIYVTSCGVYRLETVPSLSISRPDGRVDYQILYIAAGEMNVLMDKQLICISCGHAVIYRPGMPQIYAYYSGSKPEVYWVHFSGMEVAGFFAKSGIADSDFLIPVGFGTSLSTLFKQIILELQLQKIGYTEACAAYLRLMILQISRNHLNNHASGHRQWIIEKAIQYFNENYYHDIQIDTYAKEQYISVSWFIRSFKMHTGLSPHQYLISNRIGRAKELLFGTTLSLSEISALVGYGDALYFSRLFKKHTGISPSHYRKTLKNNIILSDAL